jgi:chemotaxis protein MotA
MSQPDRDHLAFVAIIGGNFLEGGHLGALANGPAALIVIGGTFGAALLQSPDERLQARHADSLDSFPPRVDLAGGIDRVVNWSLTARKEGLLGLEGVADAEPDNYAQRPATAGGRRRAGSDPQHPGSRFLHPGKPRHQAAKVFESMGGYAPTIGIIGAVMGLIHVMGNLADPSQLGSGIAVAFVATIYGVASANLVLLPMAASSSPSRCVSRVIARCCWKASCRSPKVKPALHRVEASGLHGLMGVMNYGTSSPA